MKAFASVLTVPVALAALAPFPLLSQEPLTFTAREERAESRILTGSSSADEPAWRNYLAIERDPAAAAAEAADRGDFRLIRFEVRGLARPPSYEPLFAGVDCSVAWSTGMTRAIWINTTPDVINLGPPKPPPPRFNEAVARAYNLALLHHPAFPYADLCLASDSPKGEAIAAQGRAAADRLNSSLETRSVRIVPQRWWLRWSDRFVPVTAGGNALARAVRNGEPLPPTAPGKIDQTDEFGMTALGWAAARSSPATVAQLLAAGADPWFGDQCSRRTRTSSRYGFWGEDVMAMPLVIAIVHGRRDLAMQMLRASPRKECAIVPENLPPLAGRQLTLRMVGVYAKAFEADEIHRLLIADSLDQVAAQDTGERKLAYDDLIEYAWEQGFGALLRSRPSAELLSAPSFVGHMAREGSHDDLLYWIERLYLRQPSSVAEMIGSVSLNGGSRPAMEDFAAKLETLASTGSDFAPSDKEAVVKSVFGGSVFANRSSEAKQIAVGTLKRRGYDLDSAIFTGARRGEVPNACTPLMVALSYSYSDECQPSKADPDLARALLDVGVDPNVGRTRSELSAFDLVERRIANGPWPDAFAQVRTRLLAAHALNGSRAPEPRR